MTANRLRRAFGTLLLVVGVGLLVTVGALYAYGSFEHFLFERAQAREDRVGGATATAEASHTAVALAETHVAGTSTAVATATDEAHASIETQTPVRGVATATASAPLPTSTPRPPVPTPTIQPTATRAIAAEIRRIVAPSIDLDSRVIESRIINGEWEVPKFVAGHLEGTAMPGSGSNVVLSGHVQSLTSGNVFSRLEELSVGDRIVLDTDLGEITYSVDKMRVVQNDDISVVQPTSAEQLTLITCTGTFNPLTQDYSHRLIVQGRRAA